MVLSKVWAGVLPAFLPIKPMKAIFTNVQDLRTGEKYHTNTSRRNSRRFSGFTLVELLVVISIISMLAALLMPAIQAAREASRRATCTSNQRQVALAPAVHDNTRGSLSPLRAPLRPNLSVFEEETPLTSAGLTWVGFLLPFIEQNTAWAQINAGRVDTDLYRLMLPIMQCRTANRSPGDLRISYVANAGPQNPAAQLMNREYRSADNVHFDLVGTTPSEVWAHREYGNPERYARDARMYTLFFDHYVAIGPWAGGNHARCNTRISLEGVGNMDGTSMTILLSENLDAGHWIWYDPEYPQSPLAAHWYVGEVVTGPHQNPGGSQFWRKIEGHFRFDGLEPLDPPDPNDVEALVGFCFPNELSSLETGEVPVYIPPINQGFRDTNRSPLFINEGRTSVFSIQYDRRGRTARPSSDHPGVVLAAFCDGSVRSLKEDMNRTLFVRLCRPGSSMIINPRGLDD